MISSFFRTPQAAAFRLAVAALLAGSAAVVLMPRGLADVVRRFRKSGWHYFAENIRAHKL